MTPRARIQAAATRLFARYGLEGVGMQRIADEVGLHKSSLFHHYKGKLELAAEVFSAAVAPVVDIIRPLAADDPPTIERFLAVTDDLVDHFSEHPDAARIIAHVMSAPRESELRTPDPDGEHIFRELYTIVWAWLDRARRQRVIRAVNIRQTILNLIGLVLFYPAVALEETAIAGDAPFSASARRHRKIELHHLLRGCLAPDQS
ncbi:MAG TPA: TetR/AcrR family transcriptional regulator [Kofleriaceae bacterium]|nr:TetR/AcrR family transcriptional regulator [Kofleriaceae bacterium]